MIRDDDCLAEYIGTIIPRNACRAPWTNTLDARINFQLPFRRVRTEITLDMLNLINLVDSEKGQAEYTGLGQLNVYAPISTANNTTVTATQPLIGYNLSTLMAPTFRKFFRDDLRSRWQMQLGRAHSVLDQSEDERRRTEIRGGLATRRNGATEKRRRTKIVFLRFSVLRSSV